MSATLWMLLGILTYIGAVWALLLILRANRVTDGDDAEQRRAVSRPSELGEGNDWDAEKLRREGLL